MVVRWQWRRVVVVAAMMLAVTLVTVLLPASSPGQLRVETFPLRLADDSWHRLAVTVSGDQIEVSHVSIQRATCLKIT